MGSKRTLVLVSIAAVVAIVLTVLFIFQFFVTPKDFSIKWVREEEAWGYMNEEILIYSDGRIAYTDKVSSEQHKGKLSTSELNDLRIAVRDANFYSLEDVYYIPCMDCPSDFITVTEKSKSKTVQMLSDTEGKEKIPLIPRSLNQLLDRLEDYYARKIEW